MKHLLIEHEEPINKNFYLKLLRITLTANKNRGCQEKEFNKGVTKNQACLEKIEDKYSIIKIKVVKKKLRLSMYNKNRGYQEKKN